MSRGDCLKFCASVHCFDSISEIILNRLWVSVRKFQNHNEEALLIQEKNLSRSVDRWSDSNESFIVFGIVRFVQANRITKVVDSERNIYIKEKKKPRNYITAIMSATGIFPTLLPTCYTLTHSELVSNFYNL